MVFWQAVQMPSLIGLYNFWQINKYFEALTLPCTLIITSNSFYRIDFFRYLTEYQLTALDTHPVPISETPDLAVLFCMAKDIHTSHTDGLELFVP